MIRIKKQILIVSHDPAICQALCNNMQDAFTDVCCVTSTGEALANYIKSECCLIILDAELSLKNDMELLRAIRETRHMPIMIIGDSLTSKEKVALFRAGADAFIEKPLDMDICISQANALIQLYRESDMEQDCPDAITLGLRLVICPRYRQVIVDGKVLSLTKKEFDLLYFFAKSPRQVFSRVQLYEQVWNEDCSFGVDETIKAHIKSLRKKLSFTGQEYIQTVWGTGYKFVIDDSET